MRKIAFLSTLLLFQVGPAVSAEALVKTPGVASAIELLNIWIDAQQAYEEIPGISVAVVHDQEIVWSSGFGYSDLEKKNATTADTIYSICSISKLFTSIGVMQLRDEGKLRLSDPVGRHLSWFTIEQVYPDGPPVTIEAMLTHSSGLPRESDYPYWTGPEFPFPTHDQIVKRLSEQQTLYPARTYFQYSNLGLTLAGEIVAELSGTSYEDYVAKNILNPLELNHTTTRLPEEHWGGRLATGYSAKTRAGSRDPLPLFQARGVAPAAGFASTVNDLARFASWQFRLLDSREKEVLEANTLREMHRVHWLDPDWKVAWGLGFSAWEEGGKTFVGHGGSCPGYRSQLLIQPKEKIAIVFMANASGVNASMYAKRAYEIVAPAIAAAADSSDGSDRTDQPDDSLEKYTGAYSLAPWGGEIAVLVREGELVTLSLPTDDPLKAITKLKRIDGHTFRRVRSDDELGEEVVFQANDAGEIISLRQHSNYRGKIR